MAVDHVLAALCNLMAACPEGRRAMSREPDAVPIFVDLLNLSDASEPGLEEGRELAGTRLGGR